MQLLDDALTRWAEAGLVDEDQVAAIRAWEAAHGAPPPSPPPSASPADEAEAEVAGGGLPWLGEALAYVGAAFALGAGAVLLGDVWDDLSGTARVLLALVTTAVLATGARALWSERGDGGRRLATVLAVLACVGVGATAGLVAHEFLDAADGVIAVVVGVAALAALVPVHRQRPSWPTVLVLGPALLAAVFGLLDETVLELGPSLTGTVLAGIGLAWAAAGWSGLVRPRTAFEVTGLLAGGIGCQVLAVEGGSGELLGPVLALLVALAAVAVGVTEDRVGPVVLGGAGLTVFAPQLVLRVVGPEVGGPLALLVVGIALVVASVLVLRTRAEAGS